MQPCNRAPDYVIARLYAQHGHSLHTGAMAPGESTIYWGVHQAEGTVDYKALSDLMRTMARNLLEELAYFWHIHRYRTSAPKQSHTVS
jgi:hypothetical protein